MRRLEPCSGRSLIRFLILLPGPGHKQSVTPHGRCLPCGTNTDYEAAIGFCEHPYEDTQLSWEERHVQRITMTTVLRELQSASSR
jgi:hypothetical protein